MTFTAKATSALEWQAVAAAIKTIAEEATFTATPDGLEFRAMDPSHVAMVALSWPNSSWARYECDKQFAFSLRVDDLTKLMGRADSKDEVELTRNETGESVKFLFQGSYKRDFDLHLIESTSSSAPQPKLDFDVMVKFDGKTLQKILGDVSVVSDQVTFSALEGLLLISGKSDVGRAEISLEKNSSDILEYRAPPTATKESPVKATSAIEYLEGMLKAVQGATDVASVSLSGKKPLKMEIRLGDAGPQLTFFVAPTVSES